VQFHTHISFEAKQLTHDAYKRLRTHQADRFEELVLEAFQRKVAADVPDPPGAADIPAYP
jgi:aromatic ring-cleaving dioxygenase